MSSKKKLFTSIFCAFALLANTTMAVSQSKDQSKQKSQTVTKTYVFTGDDGKVHEVGGGAAWVSKQDPGSSDHFEIITSPDMMMFQEGHPTAEFVSHPDAGRRQSYRPSLDLTGIARQRGTNPPRTGPQDDRPSGDRWGYSADDLYQ
jgi:hypothetical protein